MDRVLNRPPVRRCLFGKPSNSDGFLELQKKRQKEEEARFIKKWNLEGIIRGGKSDGNEENKGEVEVENDEPEIEWSKPDVDTLPEFFTRGYSSKLCGRRPVRPCVGKCLSFEDFDQDAVDGEEDLQCRSLGLSSSSPVQYCGSSTVEVLIGLIPHQSPQRELVTPQKSEGESSTSSVTVTKSENDSEPASVMKMPSKRRRVTRKKSFQQTRLTDLWRVLKRRQRSMSVEEHLKRSRIEPL